MIQIIKKIKKMINVNQYLENLKSDYEKTLNDKKNNRINLNISGENFKQLFLLEASTEMVKRGVIKDFLIDETNKEIINQLFFYVNCSSKFYGELTKGILILGSKGTGKTLMLNSVCNMIENLSIKVVTRVHAKRLPELLKSNDVGYYDKRPLFIDDLGREAKEINNYGTKEMPLVDLISVRYDYGALTFATSNFKIERLEEFYGSTITDRFKEMFNIFEIKGESKRC